MKTYSWSDRARIEFEKLWTDYQLAENKIEYKTWIFSELLNPYRDGEFIGYWRSPRIQYRIAKMWNKKERG